MGAIVDLIQRNRSREEDLLKRYIAILETQRLAIEGSDLDQIDRTIRFERQILDDLETFARVRLPNYAEISIGDRRSDLFATAKHLQDRNRELLAQRSAELAGRISEVRVPPRRKRVFQGQKTGGGMIDVHV